MVSVRKSVECTYKLLDNPDLTHITSLFVQSTIKLQGEFPAVLSHSVAFKNSWSIVLYDLLIMYEKFETVVSKMFGFASHIQTNSLI